jgi:EAL domain-containing protein (putative c-di-GMP-specific phosphodiesterase class I)
VASDSNASAPSAPVREGTLRTIGQEMEAVSHAFAQAGIVGLLVLDIASLQTIERTYGVAAHREVTGRVAQRVREHLSDTLGPRDQVVLGEMGRDEILVLIFREQTKEHFYREELPVIAHSMGDALQAAGRSLGYPYVREPLRFSIGKALALADPTVRPEVLIRRGRDHARRDAELNRRLDDRRRREHFVSLVLSEKVTTVFEPIVEISDGDIHGYEALVRGAKGSALHSPKNLFQTAQELDMLFEFDCLCRRSAFRAAQALPPGAKLFLNCLPSAIHDPALAGDAVRQTLQGQRLQPSDVVFEISERESIENFAIFREVCDHYRELGFQIALDDVGVGYASLEVVTELSPDYIKVDRAFVHGLDTDPPRREVLVALNSIARKIGALIIAEGIESEAELSTLRGLGIPYGQGFYLGRAQVF